MIVNRLRASAHRGHTFIGTAPPAYDAAVDEFEAIIGNPAIQKRAVGFVIEWRR